MGDRVETVTRTRQIETMAAFALIFLFLEIRFDNRVFVYLALVFLFVALFVSPVARIISHGWMKFSHLLSQINNRIILTIIFYLILTPLARLYRLFNKDPLRLLPKESGSYYCERNHIYTNKDLDKMW